jgi:16S rRNA (guanine(966)-N(2))-methyltransferase RsmD
MRIISGNFKGRRIKAPKKLPVRPTTDMAKEALFNILNHRYYFDQISVLDLFAGTGNISYEFASRETTLITAVDQNFNCIKFINSTAKEFGMSITTYKEDVFKFLEHTNQSYDIIFADPPYDLDFSAFVELVEIIFDNQLLNQDGLLIVEHSKHTDLSKTERFDQQKSYGGNCFSFFE